MKYSHHIVCIRQILSGKISVVSKVRQMDLCPTILDRGDEYANLPHFLDQNPKANPVCLNGRPTVTMYHNKIHMSDGKM